MSGAFVVLEGSDGSGKSSVLAYLAQTFAHLPGGVLTSREPGGTPEGQAVRKLLFARQTNWEPYAELLLIAAARAQHVARVIRPGLAAGKLVLCDRYIGSTLAYQGYGRGLAEARILELHAWTTGDLWPDLTLLLDLAPEQALARKMPHLAAENSSEDRFEALGLAFQQRVRRGFLDQAAAAPARHAVLDASRPLAEVQAEAAARIRDLLGLPAEGA